MKYCLLFVSVVTLFMATGCVSEDHRGHGGYGPEGEYRGYGEYRDRDYDRDNSTNYQHYPEYRP